MRRQWAATWFAFFVAFPVAMGHFDGANGRASTHVTASSAQAASCTPLRSASASDPLLCEFNFDKLSITVLPTGNLSVPLDSFQFREVVRVKARSWINRDGPDVFCSGTVIAARLVITAAHCFMWEDRNGTRDYLSARTVRERTGAPDGDLVWQDGASLRVAVEVLPDFPSTGLAVGCTDPVDLLPIAVRRVVVHESYAGSHADMPHANDLAILELIDPVTSILQLTNPATDKLRILPARLPTPEDEDNRLTIAGYGYTHENHGLSIGRLAIGWPLPSLQVPESDIRFPPPAISSGRAGSSFCSGDSGGPAFFGRHRGCGTSLQDERRPRPLAGVISTLTVSADINAEALNGLICTQADSYRVEPVGRAPARAWICRHASTGNILDLVLGCDD